MEKITQILIDIIGTALATALICLIRAGVAWISTKVHSEKIQLALQEFQTVLIDGVGYVEQTYVRLAKQEGTWDKNTQENALAMCIDYIKNNLTQTTLELLTEDKEHIEAWIESKIEAQIQMQK